jgi:transcriptional regulator with XRE-family HTH domain
MLGSFIRAQRQMANLSLRQLSALTEVSNPYLSQVERGLHEPSVRVLRSIADALDVSAETLFEHAGLISETEPHEDAATERAIRADRRLTEPQRRALLSVYRSYVEDNTTDGAGQGSARSRKPADGPADEPVDGSPRPT